jgi:hypothetical protein
MADGGDDIVVVPDAPGPLKAVPGARTPDEVDALLDELFGPDDDRGPGVADAVLATGGGAAVIAGLVLSAPVVIGLGAGAVVLGSILPTRSLWRQVGHRRLAAEREAVLGSGVALRVSPGPVAALVAAHGDLFTLVDGHPDAVGPEERAAAHAAVADVAIVLGGGVPTGPDEVAFVAESAEALASLVERLATEATVDGPEAGAWRAEARWARLAARREVDRIEGSSSADRLRRLTDERG